MAKRFHSEYISDTNDTYIIEIWDTDFSGSSTVFNTTSSGFILHYAGEGDNRMQQIVGTECTINMYAENATHEALITDITTSSEGRFSVYIKEGGQDYWRGEVIPDIGNYEEAYYPYVIKIRATDGIAALKDIDYNNDGVGYAGKITLLDHIITALSKTKWHGALISTGVFIRTYIDWWESTQTHTGSSSCALKQTYADHSAFYTFDKGVQKYESCYDVIKNILTPFGARLTMAKGVFWIEQISYRSTGVVVGRNYNKSGTLLSTANFNEIVTLNQTISGALTATGVYEFLPALKRHEHTYKSKLRRNLLSGVYNFTESSTGGEITVYQPIESNNNEAKLRLTGNISLSIKSTTAPGSAIDPFAVAFKVYLRLDTKSLKRGYIIDNNYQIQYEPVEWDTDPAYFFVLVPITDSFFLSNSLTFPFSVNQDLDIITPALPESCEDFTFEFEWWSYPIFGSGSHDPLDFDLTYTFSNMRLEVYSYGAPVVEEDEREYSCDNTTYTNNTVVSTSESLIGVTLDPNSSGGLWVKPASTYQMSYNWGIGSDTPSKYLEKILCETIVSGQARPLEKLTGTLFGTSLSQMARISWNSKSWILQGGQFNSQNGEFNGEWIELYYEGGMEASNPKIIKVISIDPQVPPVPNSSNSQGSTYELVQKPPGTLFYPVALTTTDSALSAGASTSIPISETLTDGDVYDGDTVVILNPLTGNWDELTVTATSTAGQTSIAVSGTLSVDYPANSPIIKKPKIGTFSLPEGTTGDVLYYDGTKWVAFAMGTSLQVLRVNSGGTGLEYATLSPGGTVTSVGLSMPSIFTVSGSPVTSSGTLTASLANQLQNLVFASPNGSTGAPSFRALVAADIPNIDASKITTGTLPVARGGTGLTSLGTGLQYLRVNSGATALEYATLSAITGTITALRVLFGGAGNTVDDDAEFVWDDTNKRLVIGTGTSVATLNLFKGSVASWEAFRASGSVSGNMISYFLNANNSNANANNIVGISTGGASAGDPTIQFIITGVGTWAQGIDNSDSDAFKIAYDTTPSGSGQWLKIHTDGRVVFNGGSFLAGYNGLFTGTGGVGFPSGGNANRPSAAAGTPMIRYNSDGNGFESRNTSGTYTSITKQSTPTTSLGSGSGSGASLSGEIYDNRGNIIITTGTSPTANAAVITLTFGHSYNTSAFPVISPRNAAAAAVNFYVSAHSTNSFTISISGTLAASTQYQITYIVRD